MSEEEDCDELPAISVNSSAAPSVIFTMPTAEDLAAERARELETERALQQLRSRHDPAAPAAPARVDSTGSSGSEGEAALAAAVSALQVHAGAAAAHAPTARHLLHALARASPPAAAAALRDHAAALDAADERTVAAYLDNVVAAIGSVAAECEAAAWGDAEALCAGALLAAALAARESLRGARRPAARALQRLLDDIATPDQVAALSRVVRQAVPERRARLALSDALRGGGGGGGAGRLADALLHAALADLLAAPPQEDELLSEARLAALAGAAWRGLGAEPRAALLQLLGRALAAPAGPPAPPAARRRLLAALAPPARPRSAAHRPDELEVLVGATKLRLLFRSDDD